MCDTLCALRPGGALFGKNSDRPSSEVQLVESFDGRAAGGLLSTQYVQLPDTGAHALMGARPDWLWGLEQGVNDRRVAMGNEELYTAQSPKSEPAALTGMDLVRLGLERGGSAEEALDAITGLIAEYGQGGDCTQTGNAYFSSFLIADPSSAWVLETSGRSWVAAPVHDVAAISNRITLRTEWTRSSADIEPGTDFDSYRHPSALTGHADKRLAASKACLSQGVPELTAADFAAHLRDHGTGPWGIPGADGPIEPPPETFDADGTGVTVCMHVRGVRNTTSSMIAELPADAERPLRSWVAPGSPCVSVFVPVFPPLAVPSALRDASVWHKFATLRDRVEADAGALPEIRAEFDPVEVELWSEADDVALSPERQQRFVDEAWCRVAEALERIAG
jgi:secernin